VSKDICILMESILVFFNWRNNFLFEKAASVYSLCISTRIVSASFRWCRRRHPKAKPTIFVVSLQAPLYLFSTNVVCGGKRWTIFVGGYFFSLSLLGKVHALSFFSSLHVFYCLFSSLTIL
jgi:hypothetical protein